MKQKLLDALARLRTLLSEKLAYAQAWYGKNKVVFFGVVAGVSILLVLWARLGFRVSVSEFQAAPSPAQLTISCSGESATLTWNIPDGANSNTIQELRPGASWQNIFTDATLTAIRHVDTSAVSGTQWRHKSGPDVPSNTVTCSSQPTTGQLPAPVTLSIQCQQSQNVLTWTAPGAGSNSSSILRSVDGGTNAFIQQNIPAGTLRYVDTDVSQGKTYSYTFKNHPSVGSNRVSCPAPTVPPTASTCTIAGLQVHRVTPTDQRPFPADASGATSLDNAGATNNNPYEYTNVAPGTHRLRAAPRNGFVLMGYTICSDANCSNNKEVPQQRTDGIDITCPATGGVIHTRIQYEVPTASVPLSCSPRNQNAVLGSNVSFTATGGTGTYAWDAPAAVTAIGTGASFTTRYTEPNTRSNMRRVTVTSGSETATCEVLLAATPTPTPTPTPTVIAICDYAAPPQGCTYVPGPTYNPVTSCGMVLSCPATPTPTPPSGCFYQQVQCVRAPCPPVLVCPTLTPTPTSAVSCSYSAPPQGCTYVPGPTYNPATSCGMVLSCPQNPAPIPSGANIALQVQGANISIGSTHQSSVSLRPGNAAEVRIAVRSLAGLASNVVVQAVLPQGLSFIADSVKVNGVPLPGGPITTSGVAIGSLGAGQESVVTFWAQSQYGSTIADAYGEIRVVGRAEASAERSGTLQVVFLRASSPTSGPATVPTGPADGILLALVISASVTLLYSSYTHTRIYVSRQARSLGRRHDKPDFLS